jgi:hypothetical protein
MVAGGSQRIGPMGMPATMPLPPANSGTLPLRPVCRHQMQRHRSATLFYTSLTAARSTEIIASSAISE